MLDGIDSPPVCELQLMCGHYYLFDIDPSLSGWYEARRKIGMDMDEDDVLGPDLSVVPKFLLEHEVSVLEIALAAVSFEDCSLDGSVPLDRVVVAYDCWLGALDALHPGHGFRRFGLSDLELSDDDLLGRLLSTVLFDDGGSCRFIRSVVAVVNGYRTHRGRRRVLPVCRSVSFLLLVWEMLDGFIRRPYVSCNSSTDSTCFTQVS